MGLDFLIFWGFSLSLTRTDNVCVCFLLSLSLFHKHTLSLSLSVSKRVLIFDLSLSLLQGGASFIGLCEFVGWFYLYAPANTSHKNLPNI